MPIAVQSALGGHKHRWSPETEEIQITEYEVVQQVVSETEVITEFKVDVITGTKVTVTNNPTVIASSQIMQTISEEVKSV